MSEVYCVVIVFYSFVFVIQFDSIAKRSLKEMLFVCLRIIVMKAFAIHFVCHSVVIRNSFRLSFVNDFVSLSYSIIIRVSFSLLRLNSFSFFYSFLFVNDFE